MPRYEIIVQHANGQPASRQRVSLGSNWGVSESEYTDGTGRALFESSDTSVDVYVNGRHRGTARSGRYLVTL